MSERFKVWCTKYCLTGGVTEHEARLVQSKMVEIGPGNYLFGKEWHRTKEAAVQDAEKRRQKRLASLRESIEKTEALRFTTEESENA